MSNAKSLKSYYEGAVEPIYRSVFGAAMHLAMFENQGETRDAAQTRTKEFLISHLSDLTPQTTILDLGSGYGDMARYLAQKFGCKVIGLNLIHVQNVRSLEFSQEIGLDDQIAAIEADFGQVPFSSGMTSTVWSQEALLHAPDRGQVLQEAARLLKSGGTFLFTDLIQTAPMQPEEAKRIYERVKIDSFETFDSYHTHLQHAGLAVETVVDLSRYVAESYQNHIDEIHKARGILDEAVGSDFIIYTVEAMGRWVTAAQEGKLGWGMFVARKP